MVRAIDASRFGEIMEQWKKDCLECDDQYGADVISDVILQLDDMPTLTPPNEWVSVEKGLPKAECGESDSVLAITELGTMHVVYSDGGCWCRPTGETFPHKITHWMLLPVPPDRRPPEGESPHD